MAPRDTFTLRVPHTRPVEVHLVELEDGTIVARTADELARADAPTRPPESSR